LDLSLTRSGVAAAPLNWAGDTRRVTVFAYRHSETPHTCHEIAKRLDNMASGVVTILKKFPALTTVGVEDVPTHDAYQAVRLSMLHGVIRVMLERYMPEVELVTYNQSTIRQLLLGKLPARDRKTIAIETVKSLPGCANWGGDECDAFVVLNAVLGDLGATVIAAPEPEKPKRRRTRRTKSGLLF
jgi:Holliday junction resolvasome RuvABC endonuclease subunit